MEIDDKNTPPPILYHYTTLKGILGIFKKEAIWATNIFYLNDTAEFKHATKILKKIIKQRIENICEKLGLVGNVIRMYQTDPVKSLREVGPIKVEQKPPLLEIQFLRLFLQVVEGLKFPSNIYTCSFSINGNVLEQWRGYCKYGNGYSLGFNTKYLIQKMKANKFDLIKCIYEDEDQEKKITCLLDKYTMNTSNKSANLEMIRNAAEKSYYSFLKIAPQLKDKAFENEDEWRFVKAENYPKKIKFREGKSMIIPYLPIKLEPIEIEKIFVGPTPDQELSRKAVFSLLKSRDIYDKNELKGLLFNTDARKECSVILSNIPYRE